MIIAALFFLGSVTATERISVGTVISPLAVEGSAADVDRFAGRQTTRTVFAGRQIAYADTKEADLVDRNGIVRIVARKGPLTIETKGRALGAGPSGEEILVMNLESRRTVTARIVGPNLVEVDL